MSAKRQKDEGWISWGLIVLLFIFGLSPLALVLLFLKLFGVGSGEKKQQAAPPPLNETTGQRTSERVGRQASQPNRAQKTVHQVMKAPSQTKSTARTLMIAGAILAAVGVIAVTRTSFPFFPSVFSEKAEVFPFTNERSIFA